MNALPTDLPMPLDWHPAYRDKPWLMDWLTGTEHEVRIPVNKPLRVHDFDDAAEVSRPADATVLLLTKHRAAAPAPWTHRPYQYAWPVGVDQMGRAIAGDSTPHLLGEHRAPW